MGEPTDRLGTTRESLSSSEEERRLEGIRKAEEVNDGTEAMGKTPDAAIAEQSKRKTGLEFGPEEEIKDGVQQLTNVDVKDELVDVVLSEAERQAELLKMIGADHGPFNADATIKKLQEKPLDTQ